MWPVDGLKPERANTTQNAIQRSLPVLQRSNANFASKSGCISCHNNSLAAMAVGLVRKSGFRVDEQIATHQVKANVSYLEQQRDNLHQGSFAAQAGAEGVADLFGPVVLRYILVGLHAEHYEPGKDKDATKQAINDVLALQRSDGWSDLPSTDSHAYATGRALFALQTAGISVSDPVHQRQIGILSEVAAYAMSHKSVLCRLVGGAGRGSRKDLRREFPGVRRIQGNIRCGGNTRIPPRLFTPTFRTSPSGR